MDNNQYLKEKDTLIEEQERILLIQQMEKEYNNNNIAFFTDLLFHHDHVIRTRSVCILANIANEGAVLPISNVLKEDPDELVRHEAAFSLGQLGFTTGINALCKSLKEDPSFFVRHEAAIALGVIGSEKARKYLEEALSDSSIEVKKSAIVALVNIEYISKFKKINKFTQMTGG